MICGFFKITNCWASPLNDVAAVFHFLSTLKKH